MVSRGHFVLHSRVVPPLTAGDYVLEGQQRIVDPDGGTFPTEPYGGHVRVSSPRYRMPPDQILSTYPPANAEGAFESRLPQVVVRRRTLPWERTADPADRKVPWLALVVIAEGEGALSTESPIAECVTPGVTLDGPNDVPTGVYLSVPQAVVTKVFPTKNDLQLLAHVREVDIGDTELAMGDDDGFLAVILANRLPQFDRVGCKPTHYLACLINLEGQLNALPLPTPPRDHFFPGEVVFQLEAKAAFLSNDLDHVIMGRAKRPAVAAAHAAPRRPMTTAAARRAAITNQWNSSPAAIEGLAVSASATDAGTLVREAMVGRFRFPIEGLILEKTYRFPVLAHWSFSCTGAGSFESLMQGLDVGMLGTVAGRPTGKPFPECFTPPGGDAPPNEPPKRPQAELAETGHVGLPHRTRRGESVRAWYRGPLVPNLTVREAPQPDGRLPLAHVSDQLRRLVPDGREDLAFAAAFEIGRLLALSHPSIVAALTRWRTEQFGAARAKRLSDLVLENIAIAAAPVAAQVIRTYGARVSRKVVELAAAVPDKILGSSRPSVDPGRPIDAIRGNFEEIIATGFGLEVERVRAALNDGNVSALEEVAVPSNVGDDLAPSTLGHLSQGLDAVLEHLTNDALSTSRVRRGSATRRLVRDKAQWRNEAAPLWRIYSRRPIVAPRRRLKNEQFQGDQRCDDAGAEAGDARLYGLSDRQA